jgi:hypothetical protein
MARLRISAIGISMTWAMTTLCRALLFAGALSLAGSVARAEEASPRPARPAVYEIPAQKLDDALRAYIATSGMQLLYETTLTEGRRSTELKGSFAPDAALQALLAETGLAARRTDVDAFVITPAPVGAAGPSASTAPIDSRFMTALQAGVLDALCRDPLTRPGGYKVGIELWIAPSGAVQQSALIGSTGDAERDAAISNTLRRASVRIAPPAGTQQPFILIIGPRGPQETGDCTG